MTRRAHPPKRRDAGYVPARRRIALAASAGVVVGGASAFLVPWQLAVLMGWDAVAVFIVGGFWRTVRAADADTTAARAKIDDPSRALSDLILVAASVTSLLGVGLALAKASSVGGLAQALITGVAVATVALSWLCVHSAFTLRYADLYYATGDGINFHDEDAPDYRDFAYVAFTIGMTYQVSDTDLTSHAMRAAAVRHALLSYVFGIAVIATTINVVAGLLNR